MYWNGMSWPEGEMGAGSDPSGCTLPAMYSRLQAPFCTLALQMCTISGRRQSSRRGFLAGLGRANHFEDLPQFSRREPALGESHPFYYVTAQRFRQAHSVKELTERVARDAICTEYGGEARIGLRADKAERGMRGGGGAPGGAPGRCGFSGECGPDHGGVPDETRE